MTANNATSRFSARVADYVKCRPSYPIEIIDLFAAKCGLTPESVIADIGSGSGLLTKLFLDNGNLVAGVEPNLEMREAGEHYLADYARFTSINGTAEATRLPADSFDFIVTGQAFHWFDQVKTRTEFKRILKDKGTVALIWNDRRVDSTPFLRDYEDLLQTYGTDYNEIKHKNVQDAAVFSAFFGGEFFSSAFDHAQHFAFEGLMGRLNSSSYVPNKNHQNYAPLVRRAKEIFEAHNVNGRVVFEYDTRVYYGAMT